MNYQKIYNNLVLKARNANRKKLRRNNPNYQYFESHHIIPECIGGLDHKENKVLLTPEEHYLAHQLLVKIYPKNHNLVHAAKMLIPNGNNQKRNNKMYGWLKKRLAKVLSDERMGKSWEDLFGKEKADRLKVLQSKKLKGVPKSKQHRKNISKGQLGRIRDHGKKVFCVELNRNFRTIEEAAKFIGYPKIGPEISKAAQGKRNKVKDYTWYFVNEVGKPVIPNYDIEEKNNGRKIKCSETGEIFLSLRKAAKFANLKNPYDIADAAKRKPGRNTAGGYNWEFV